METWITQEELIKIGVFWLAGTVGTVAHFYKRKLKNQTELGLISFFLCRNFRATLVTGLTLLAALLAGMATGIVSSATFSTLIGLGFTTGFTLNSTFNKGE